MKLLVVGSGGREHAITWKLSQSKLVEKIFLAPGNPGSAREEKCVSTGIAAHEYERIKEFSLKEKIDFVVIGPDQALADGLVDLLEAAGIAAFGPTQKAAQLEASKIFAKNCMREFGIPTAAFHSFAAKEEAREFLAKGPEKAWVVKVDGLALGKGVVVCSTKQEALEALQSLDAEKFLLEDRLHGPELSAFFLCDGESYRLLACACDYKRIFDGNEGPNTGGMGSYSPVDWYSEEKQRALGPLVVEPLLHGMKQKGIPYRGVLFVGFLITQEGPKVLEFNARFGDPETQSLLPILEGDLLPLLLATRNGSLAALPDFPARKKYAVHVVCAAKGYPGSLVEKGKRIETKEFSWTQEGLKVFYAGVKEEAGHYFTNGGRVLGVSAIGDSRAQARAKAYAAIAQISFTGMQTRSDIGA